MTALAANQGANSALRRLLQRKMALFGLALVVLIVGAAILAPLIAPFDPFEQHFDGLSLYGEPLPPDATYLLGTDLLGRDLLSRLLYGARTSLIIGVMANGMAMALWGVPLHRAGLSLSSRTIANRRRSAFLHLCKTRPPLLLGSIPTSPSMTATPNVFFFWDIALARILPCWLR